ncbi:hypothetical protein [Pyrococcus sp. ST04]|uniref:hypothetical protein n=1 Tax=Pyrococcus sp. ST04 TaxID=1183377 RepID=UPI00064E67DF|nr:hypothetical protein [Pyrococcus sp. ST04]
MKKLALLSLAIAVLMISGCLGGGGTSTIVPSSNGEDEQYTQTETPETSEIPTETQTQSETSQEKASWASPWDISSPITVDGRSYKIVAIKYRYKVRHPDSEKVFEYIVEKRKSQTEIMLYGGELNLESGNVEKVEIGKVKVYEYYTKLTPVSGEFGDPVEFYVWTSDPSSVDTYFAYPASMTLLLAPGVVATKVASGDKFYIFYNPPGIGNYDYMPYTEGSLDWFKNSKDVESLYLSFMVVTTFPFWGALEEDNLYSPHEESYSVLGFSYNYRVTPDSEVSISEHTYRTSKVEWTYSIPGGGNGKGSALISASLPIPIKLEGVFVSPQGDGWYLSMELLELGLEEA